MKKIILILFLIVGCLLSAQEAVHKKPPIPIEFTFGHERANLQTVLNLPFSEKSRFSFFNVTTGSVPYKNKKGANELVSINNITYRLIKNVYGAAGFQFHFLKGFVPMTGIQYVMANKKWLVILTPNLNYAPSLNFETIGILEFKPKFNEKVGLYSRIQGLYNHNMDEGFHDRSYVNFRLSINTYTLGFAANFDYYGPDKLSENNFGVFIRHSF